MRKIQVGTIKGRGSVVQGSWVGCQSEVIRGKALRAGAINGTFGQGSVVLWSGG